VGSAFGASLEQQAGLQSPVGSGPSGRCGQPVGPRCGGRSGRGPPLHGPGGEEEHGAAAQW